MYNPIRPEEGLWVCGFPSKRYWSSQTIASAITSNSVLVHLESYEGTFNNRPPFQRMEYPRRPDWRYRVATVIDISAPNGAARLENADVDPVR